ncbi:hypothetical protein ACWEQ8_27600 [Streptomyces noursei]
MSTQSALQESAARARRAIADLIGQAGDEPQASYRVLVQLFWTDASVLGTLASGLDDLAAGLTTAEQDQASRAIAAVVKELRRFTGDHDDVTRALQILAPHQS